MRKVLFGIVAMTIALASCKKDDSSSNNNSNSIADSYVGIWNMRDSFFYQNAFTGTVQNYNFTIAKKDDNTVYVYNFVADTAVFSVSETAMAYISGASGSGASYASSLAITRSGNKIYTESPESDGGFDRGTATKQ